MGKILWLVLTYEYANPDPSDDPSFFQGVFSHLPTALDAAEKWVKAQGGRGAAFVGQVGLDAQVPLYPEIWPEHSFWISGNAEIVDTAPYYNGQPVLEVNSV